MSEKDKFEGQKKKLENLCEEHNLTYSLKLDTYPVAMTLRPIQGMYEQLSMLEAAEDGEMRISQDAYKTFCGGNADYWVKSFGTFTMGTELERKFLNIFKKIDILEFQPYIVNSSVNFIHIKRTVIGNYGDFT